MRATDEEGDELPACLDEQLRNGVSFQYVRELPGTVADHLVPLRRCHTEQNLEANVPGENGKRPPGKLAHRQAAAGIGIEHDHEPHLVTAVTQTSGNLPGNEATA